MLEENPNVQLIHKFFQAYASKDLNAIQEILSPEIKWIIPGKHPFSGTKTGVEEVLSYFKALSTFDFHATPIVMGANEEYVIDCHWNWSDSIDGERFRNMSCLLWKISGGKIIEVYNFPQEQHLVDAFFNR